MTGRFCAFYAAAAVWAAPTIAQQQFDTPEAAAQALINAAESHASARLAAIFGARAEGILVSGDPAQDRAEQSEFARLALSQHRFELSPMNPNRTILAIGEEDWPFPVPILRTNGKWAFDASETPAEMRARHIGADELDIIEICHGYVEAQMKYASEDRDQDGMLEYSPHLMSRPGSRDGLYWQGASEPLIPEGFAHAEWDGLQKGGAKPYHGYYFRVLSGQGPSAPGGAHNYLVKDKMIGGFGLLAWPAEYGGTGIHTFLVNQRGVVYQKDIAPVAGKPFQGIALFDPDSTWEPVE